MILRERIEIRTSTDEVKHSNVPAEVSHGQLSVVQIVQSDADVGNVRVTFYGTRQDVVPDLDEEGIIFWRGRRHSIQAIPELHYVKGRFSHWEVTTNTNGMVA